MVVCPKRTSPSTGILSPGNTCNHSPTRTCSAGISIILAPAINFSDSGLIINRAVCGTKANNWRNALAARTLACFSKVLPKRIKPNIITGSSKKHSQPIWGNNNATKLAI